METLEEIRKIRPDRDATVTIGNFDGLHLGHEYLLREVIARARAHDRAAIVLTFFPHPRIVLAPNTTPSYIQPISERLASLSATGVDHVVVIRFNREVAALTAQDFCRLLTEHLRMRELVLGEGATLGRNREGNIPTLRMIGESLGFTVAALPKLTTGGHIVSSTAVRRALAAGDLATANRLLGRPFRLHGPVVRGDERGRTIGFPTANIRVPLDQMLPADGVYAVFATFDGEKRPGVMNIGIRPSFGGGERTIEVFLLDWSGDLYGRDLTVDLVTRLRPEQRFTSIDDLIAQIHRDVEQAREVLVS